MPINEYTIIENDRTQYILKSYPNFPLNPYLYLHYSDTKKIQYNKFFFIFLGSLNHEYVDRFYTYYSYINKNYKLEVYTDLNHRTSSHNVIKIHIYPKTKTICVECDDYSASKVIPFSMFSSMIFDAIENLYYHQNFHGFQISNQNVALENFKFITEAISLETESLLSNSYHLETDNLLFSYNSECDFASRYSYDESY